MHGCSLFFGRTQLRIGVSEATNGLESCGEVRFHVAPQKPDKNTEKRISESEQVRQKQIWCQMA